MVTLNPLNPCDGVAHCVDSTDDSSYCTCEDRSCIYMYRYIQVDVMEEKIAKNDERNCSTLCKTQDIHTGEFDSRIHVELGRAYLAGIGVMVLLTALIPQMTVR